MTKEDLSQLVNDQPFLPFTLTLADGSDIRVSHPDAIAVGSRVAYCIVPAPERTSGDRAITVAIRHITKIEREEPAVSDEN